MIRKLLITTLFTLGATGSASAEDCAVIDVEDQFDIDDAAIAALYECLGDKMAEGYAAEGDEIGATYRSWTPTQTAGAIQGAHGKRILFTYANDVAADQYLKFEEEGVNMPIGSTLAKESISISTKKKQARPGPLFIMTKVGTEEAPETGGWLYAGLQPSGKVMKVKQNFCHDCHTAWESQDSLAYPIEEYRVGAQ